jgi:integrase
MGEGTVGRHPDGRWIARLQIDGRRRSFYGRTRAEAVRKLQDAIRTAEAGLPIPDERSTVGTYLEGWLASQKPPALRPSTWTAYRFHLRHAAPMADIRLARLAPADLERLYRQLLDGDDGHEPLSPTTVHHLHRILHRALGQAVRQGILARNVAALVDGPRIARHEMRTLSPEEVRRFLRAAVDDRLDALYVLAVTTGLRRGELLALRWSDIDLVARTLAVRGTLQREGGLSRTEPKTPRSRRRVELTYAATEALQRHRQRQAAERLAASRWAEPDLVFATTEGSLIEPSNMLRRSFAPLLEHADLPPIRFHDLRHTAATLHLALGTHPKVVSDMLGHASVGITLDTYSHAVPSLGREAARAMEALLGEDQSAERP